MGCGRLFRDRSEMHYEILKSLTRHLSSKFPLLVTVDGGVGVVLWYTQCGLYKAVASECRVRECWNFVVREGRRQEET